MIARLALAGLLLAAAACTAKPARDVAAPPAPQSPRQQLQAQSVPQPAVQPAPAGLRAPARDRAWTSDTATFDEVVTTRGQNIDRQGGTRQRGAGAAGDITLNFTEADLREVVKVILGNILNVNYVIDPNVTGKVTLKTDRPLRRASLIPTLEAILATQQAKLIAQGDVYRIARTADPSDLAAGGIGVARGPLPDGAGLQVFPLDFISASEMEKILKPLLPAGSIVHADNRRNVIIVAGTGPQIRLVSETVDIFDVDQMAGQNVLVLSLRNADPRIVVAELESIFGIDGGVLGLARLVNLIPLDRLGAVLVASKQMAYIEKARNWIQKLDAERSPSERRVFVYYVQHSRASKLAESLKDLTGWVGPESADQGAPAPAGDAPKAAPDTEKASIMRASYRMLNQNSNLGTGMRVAVDEERNALLISSTPKDFLLIEDVLAKLDIQPLQVMIETSIFEVTLRDELRYGIQYAISNGGLGITGDGLISLTRGTTTATTARGLAQPIVNTLLPGFGFTLEGESRARFVVDALSQMTEVDMISSPNVIVLNNQSATLRVGDEVPIVTQTAASTLTTNPLIVNTVQYRSTGVGLEVTPRVNASGMITLDITQEVSDVTTTTTSTINSPTIQNRSILSTVSIRSGDTIMLGGLIRETALKSHGGIPILHEIPVIGVLFGQKNKQASRTELVVMIRPIIVSNPDQARNVTVDMKQKFLTLLQREQTGIAQPRRIIEKE